MFLQKYQDLKTKHPLKACVGYNNANSDYGSYIFHCKNNYHCFDGSYNEDSAYLYDSLKMRDCFDCCSGTGGELLYECHNILRCYDCSFIDDASHLRHCHFCASSSNCEHCFGCVHLNHNKYCIFNVQYSKEEYFKYLNQLWQRPAEEHLKKVEEIRNSLPFKFIFSMRTEKSPYGDFIYGSKNCYWGFKTYNCEDCAYQFDAAGNKDCYDLTQTFNSQLSYQCTDSSRLYKSAFLEFSTGCKNCFYCYYCTDCEHCFGCAFLKNKKYCILNKPYSKEEYFAKLKQLKKELNWPIQNTELRIWNTEYRT